MWLALQSVPQEVLAVLRVSLAELPEPGVKLRLQRKLSHPIHQSLRSAFTAAISGDPARMAADVSQCGWLGSAWLRAPCSIRAGTRFSSQVFSRLLQLYLGLGVLEVPGVPCPGRADGELLSPTTALASFMGGNAANNYRLHNEVRDRVQAIIESMPGTVRVEREVPDSPHTTPAQRAEDRHVPAEGFKMDLKVRGIAAVGCVLHIDVTVATPTVSTHVANAALVPNYAARKGHEAKIAKYQVHAGNRAVSAYGLRGFRRLHAQPARQARGA